MLAGFANFLRGRFAAATIAAALAFAVGVWFGGERAVILGGAGPQDRLAAQPKPKFEQAPAQEGPQDAQPSSLDRDAPDYELLKHAFTDPLSDKDRQLLPPVRNINDLRDRIQQFTVFPSQDFYTAYERIEPGSVERPRPGLAAVPFMLGQAKGTAYSFPIERPGASCAILFIPGTGHNPSGPTVEGRGSYGSIIRDLAARCNIHVLIKPNEDVRAIHDGRNKLSGDFIHQRALRYGSSYGVTYLIEALAFAKQLKKNHRLFGIVGLSQGGEAAFLLSLQASPDFAVVAAGFSLIQYRALWAAVDQIALPGMYRHYSLDALKETLGKQSTDYLFSYGRADSGDYRIETTTGETCRFLAAIDAKRIRCVIHDGGHDFPRRETLAFIQEALNK